MKKNRLPKANQATKQKRLDQVLSLRGQGFMRYQLLVMLGEEWGMSESGVDKYWDASSKILKEGFTDEDLIAGYKEIYKRTLDSSPAIAAKVYDSIAKVKKGGFNGTEIIFKLEHKDEDEGNKDNQGT